MIIISGAAGRSRTDMRLLSHDFESPYNFSLRLKFTGQACASHIFAIAGRESRTLMDLRPHDFESCASTGSAIPAKAKARLTACPASSSLARLVRGSATAAREHYVRILAKKLAFVKFFWYNLQCKITTNLLSLIYTNFHYRRRYL